MKFLYLSVFFLAFHIITWGNNPKETQFVAEPFSFEAKGHLKLEGTLIIPESFILFKSLPKILLKKQKLLFS